MAPKQTKLKVDAVAKALGKAKASQPPASEQPSGATETKGPKAAAPKAGLAIQRAEAKAASAKAGRPSKGRELKRNNTDIQVERALRDNFPKWGPELTDGILCDNMTLRDRLVADKRRQKDDSSFAMGGPYYERLRQVYMPDGYLASKLKVKDRSNPVREALPVAIEQAQASPANRGPILDILRSRQVLNQREMVGLLKYIFKLRPSASAGQAAVAIEFVRYITDIDLTSKMPEELAIARPFIDDTLAHVLATMRRENMSVTRFWQLHKRHAALVLDAASADLCLHAENWRGLEDKVRALTSSSRLGAKMFDMAMAAVCSIEVKTWVEAILKDMNGQRLTADLIRTSKDTLLQECNRLDAAIHLSGKRAITVAYRDTDVEVEITGLHEDLEMRMAGYIKSRAINAGALPMIHGEDILLPLVKTDDKPWNEDILEQYAIPREELSRFMEQASFTSGDMLTAILAEKETVLIMMDNSIRLELQWLRKMVASGAEKRLEGLLLGHALPSPDRGVRPNESLERLRGIQASVLHNFLTKTNQALLNLTVELVDQIDRGSPPAILTCPPDKTLQAAIHTRLDMFPEAEMTSDDGSTKLLRGAEAIQAIYQDVELKVKDNKLESLHELSTLHTFEHLLQTPQKEALATWAQQMLQVKSRSASSNPTTSAARPSSATTGKATREEKAKPLEASAGSKRAETMAMFD